MLFGGVRLNLCRAKYRIALSANQRGSRSPALAAWIMCLARCATRRSIFIGAVGRATHLHSTSCVLESIFENTRHRRVKRPVSVMLDGSPARPDSRLLNGRERSAFPAAAIPFAASNGRYSTHLLIAGLRHTPANPVNKPSTAASTARHESGTLAQPPQAPAIWLLFLAVG